MDPNGAPTWVARAGFGVLTLNSGLAIYRSKGDAGAVAFVVGSYSFLLLQFACLRRWRADGEPESQSPAHTRPKLPPMASPKANHQPNPAAPASNRRVPWAALIGFVGLAVNFALCVYRADGDRSAIAFVSFSYLNLLLLFWCIRQFEQSPPGSAARGRIKAAVWLLATSLTVIFTWIMPLLLAVVAWIMAAIYRSKGDAGAVVFVVVSYSSLLLLFACLRAYEREAPDSPARSRLKRAVWALSTFLTTMFAWKVAALMPWPVAAVVWGLAVHTSVGGFLVQFHRLNRRDSPKSKEQLILNRLRLAGLND